MMTQDGKVWISTKTLGWLLSLITIPLLIFVFNDLRGQVRDNKRTAEVADRKADITAAAVNQIRDDIRDIKDLLKEQRQAQR